MDLVSNWHYLDKRYNGETGPLLEVLQSGLIVSVLQEKKASWMRTKWQKIYVDLISSSRSST